jgi:hypothetical protein
MAIRERISSLLWGTAPDAAAPSYFLTRWIFLRALGIVYLVAFVSLWVQIHGLYGHNGILPAHEFLTDVAERNGSQSYYLLPTLFWFSASDGALHAVCAAGTVVSVLLILGVVPIVSSMLLWILYLSLFNIGQVFLGFQWDALLLETGFLAIFFAPITNFLKLNRDDEPSRIVLWLLRWLVFRLMFSSGVVKLSGGDLTWRNLTALTVHYQTQPLPVWTSWYLHQAPVWFQKASTLLMFFIELIVPFTVFAPRRLRYIRHVGACIMILFQLLLMATGNYCFFNILAIVLCIPLFEDAGFPERWRKFLAQPALASDVRSPRWRPILMAPLACVIVALSFVAMLDRMHCQIHWPAFVGKAESCAAPFRSVAAYGLFEQMTTTRREIVIEGSADGEHWAEYEFKYKPGDTHQRPVFIAPYQPRLDWQMWFAALSNYRDNPWFSQLLQRMLEGSPQVLGLLGKNPFPDAPPKYLRAIIYEYTFTDSKSGADGAWWLREKKGLYCPVFSLSDDEKKPDSAPAPDKAAEPVKSK